jgi:transposase
VEEHRRDHEASKRRNPTAGFKARIALEAIKGVKTFQQVAPDNHLHPVLVTPWKTQRIDSASGGFARAGSGKRRRRESNVDQLFVELDWLKKCKELGIDPSGKAAGREAPPQRGLSAEDQGAGALWDSSGQVQYRPDDGVDGTRGNLPEAKNQPWAASSHQKRGWTRRKGQTPR